MEHTSAKENHAGNRICALRYLLCSGKQQCNEAGFEQERHSLAHILPLFHGTNTLPLAARDLGHSGSSSFTNFTRSILVSKS